MKALKIVGMIVFFFVAAFFGLGSFLLGLIEVCFGIWGRTHIDFSKTGVGGTMLIIGVIALWGLYKWLEEYVAC